jgi:hypothetical protein
MNSIASSLHRGLMLGRWFGLSLLLITASCGDDGNDSSNSDGSVVGTWDLQSIVGRDGDQPLRRVPFCEVSGTDSACTVSGYARFASGGTGQSSVARRVIVYTDGERSELFSADTTSFTWTQAQNEITVNEDPDQGIFRIEGGLLNLYIDADGNGSFEYLLGTFNRR